MPRIPDSSPQTLKVFGSLVDDPSAWHYGYGLSKQTGLAPGTLYPILARLVERDLLETRWEPSDQPGRPPRHLYRLTGSGRALAAELATVTTRRPGRLSRDGSASSVTPRAATRAAGTVRPPPPRAGRC